MTGSGENKLSGGIKRTTALKRFSETLPGVDLLVTALLRTSPADSVARSGASVPLCMALSDLRSDFVRQNCPTVVFHESEQFFPCSIEHLLKDSSLIRRRRGDANGTNDFHVGDATPQELASYLNDDQYENFLEIFPSQFAGHAPVDGIVTSPVYIAFVETEDLFVDVYYIFLYAYQGSQTFRCTPPIAKHFNCIAHEYGRHQGDLEHFIVRTDASFSAVLSVAYEAHGRLAWFFPGVCTHPILPCDLAETPAQR